MQAEQYREELTHYAERPLAFLGRYIKHRALAHAAILAAVLIAVGCSVGSQYGLKALVDALSGPRTGTAIWGAFAILVGLIAGDNLLWRAAGWLANYTFVAVTVDLRADLFRHLTGHAPSYFADRMPGTLASRITATSNAVYAVETMFIWNVLPPVVATLGSIFFLATVSLQMTAAMTGVAAVMIVILFKLAARGAPLHRNFADCAAAADGEMVDVISNLSLVRAFGGLAFEHRRFDETIGRESVARRRSLFYLEKLRLFHAVVTATLTAGLLAWAVLLWESNTISTGDVVLVCTLGFGILHATRDLAVALVDATQHMARLEEAIATLLVPHTLRDVPSAPPLRRHRGAITFDGVRFAYPDGRKVFDRFNLHIEPEQRVALVGESGGGKSTLFALLQRFHDPQSGQIRIDCQDIATTTQDSLRAAIAVVPQDVGLLNRSVIENIRYGRPDIGDAEVIAAADAARCTEFIEMMPQGFATVIGDRGVKLSGGQRQRIAIARAILKGSPILLLDEATSALDTESESVIREALDRVMEGRTVIASAHRLSTVADFDRIIVLRDGRILEDGPPDVLLASRGAYYALVEKERRRLVDVALGDLVH
ncbi:MAG TPA: ABC transporter ATP-binding protein [Stellaceae bacterium]|jgi:ATP-binding cassette subfamily B protein|nr:ABC transporter ATP-binding protein [Stellaceae bacterium]